MTFEIGFVLAILGLALVLFVTELIRMELVALLVLCSLVLSQLVTPAEALSGFSNPAVVTVWAMFILSAGLTRAGVAAVIGSRILRWVGSGELRVVFAIMIVAAVLSAFMNNIGVAALLLPVVMNVSRRTRIPPSQLLIPLAFGSLLGGLTTLIGTPPNLLISESMREHGLTPFSMFDYSGVGGAVALAGTLFVALAGRRLLPRRDPAAEAARSGLGQLPQQYRFDERSAMVRILADSPLVGKTLQESRLGTATDLVVYAIIRGNRTILAPAAGERLQAADRLLVEGKLDRFNEMRGWRELIVDDNVPDLDHVVSKEIGLAEVIVAPGAALVGQTLAQLDFRNRYGGIVMALSRGHEVIHTNLARCALQSGDRLLIQARRADLDKLLDMPEFEASSDDAQADLLATYDLRERLFAIRVPEGSQLEGRSLGESRLGDAVGMGAVAVRRGETTLLLPQADEPLHAGDELVVRGRRDDLAIFRGIQGLQIEAEAVPELGSLESERAGLVEAMLSPRTTLAGKTPAQLQFRERYGLQILAILREGRARRTGIRGIELRFGDALLMLGPREKLQVLERDRDFILLSEVEQPIADRRAPLAVLIMAGVVVPAVMGWLPISIAALTGSALMVLLRCLSMDDALRAIDWRPVFLIAGMLPLGLALQKTGAAVFVAESMLAAFGDAGPWTVLIAIYLITAALTCVIPTAALVVLMAPIAIKTSASVGLSPNAIMMAVAMASSASFTSPISHPANLLVMGPGGYRFVDYIKVGVPLTLLIMVVVLLVLPWLWPLAA